MIDRSSDRARIEIARSEEAARSLRARNVTDGGQEGPDWRPTNTYRIEVHAPEAEPVSALIALGGIPETAIGRDNAGESAECGERFQHRHCRTAAHAGRRLSEVLLMARDEQAQLTGHGWSAVDWDPVGVLPLDDRRPRLGSCCQSRARRPGESGCRPCWRARPVSPPRCDCV